MAAHRHMVRGTLETPEGPQPVSFCGLVGIKSAGCVADVPFCSSCKVTRFAARAAARLEQSRGLCPECGTPLRHVAGCTFCENCGWERC